MFGWNDSYSVGMAEIDAQHKQLFAMIGELNDAMKQGKSKDVLGTTLQRLHDYTVKHFSYEQSVLQQKGYGDYASHKAIHDEFTRRIRKYQQEYAAGTLGVSVELMDMLQGVATPGYGKFIESQVWYGNPMQYTIPCSGIRPIAFTATGLPEGLSLDTKRGWIVGTMLNRAR